MVNQERIGYWLLTGYFLLYPDRILVGDFYNFFPFVSPTFAVRMIEVEEFHSPPCKSPIVVIQSSLAHTTPGVAAAAAAPAVAAA